MDKRKCLDTLYQDFRAEIEKVRDEKLKVNKFGDEYFVYLKIKRLLREEARMVTGELALDTFWYDMGWSPSDNVAVASGMEYIMYAGSKIMNSHILED